MKTAEEWYDDYTHDEEPNVILGNILSRDEAVAFIKQIQLDAWKQGMSDAAHFCRDGLTTEGEYRIKLEPKLRPWKPEEVPVGASLKNKSTLSRYLITGWCCAEPNYVLTSGGKYSPEDLAKSYEYSLDNGKTWRPCGTLK